MEIYQFIGRNLEITDAMRSYAEEKLDRLTRFYDHIVDAKVVMGYKHSGAQGMPATVEVQLNVPHGIVRAEESGLDTYVVVDMVVDKLERQLKRFKGRHMARRQDPVDIMPALPVEEKDTQAPEVVRVKRHALRPMQPEDAAVQMEALGHSFYMFLNSTTDTINVIYLRNDGDYGLLEPAT